MTTKQTLNQTYLKTLLKRAGARVITRAGFAEFEELIDSYANALAKYCVAASEHRGSNTIQVKDVIMACKIGEVS